MPHTTRYLKKKTREFIFKWHGLLCFHCRNLFPLKELTADHIIPKAHGGTAAWDNLVPACEPCNHTRGMTPLSPEQLEAFLTLAQAAFEAYLEDRHGDIRAVRAYRRRKARVNND